MDTSESDDRSGKFSGCFVGGIPPFLLFETEYHSLFHLAESHKNDQFYKNVNPATKAAHISLVAHFEAFCKHQFAALINIWPALLGDFAARRPQASLTLSDLATCFDDVKGKIGFLLAEQYDFGSATQINGLFRDLLNVTPFSGDDAETFYVILAKRHLLVHHAGYYTLQHLKKHSISQEVVDRAFKDCVVLDTEDYHRTGDFLFNMAMKVARTTVAGLDRKWRKGGANVPYPTEALQRLLTGVGDVLDEVEPPSGPDRPEGNGVKLDAEPPL